MLHGRAHECEVIDGLLEGARQSRGGALVIRGEEGTGKTALLDHAVGGSGLRVLTSSGAQSESGLPFAQLHQLLRPVLDGLDSIPDLQADALRSVLGLASAQAPDRFLIGLAVLTLLSDAAAEQPVLCVVDNGQWLDPESLEALAFVARRVNAEPITLLIATTEAAGSSLGPFGIPEIALTGLDRYASDALLIERSGRTPAPEVRAFLWRSTGGNPLALIETAGALSSAQLEGREPLPDEIGAGGALQHTLLMRVNQLPVPTRELLLVAAAEGTGDLGLVLRTAASMGFDPASLESAERSGIVRVDDGQLVFSHPLMRTALYQGTPFGRRQTAHRALADSLTDARDADRRAWHRSAAVVGPDDAVADELDAAGTRASQRGGHIAASIALERASVLTSDRARAAHRMVEAAEDAWLAGRTPRTRTLLERAEALEPEPAERANADHLRGLVESASGDRRIGFDALLAAADYFASSDGAKTARILIEAGNIAWSDSDAPGMIDVARRLAALDLPEGAPETCGANVMIGLGDLVRGDVAAGASRIEASVANADPADPRQLHIAGTAAMFVGDDRTAHDLLAKAMARARALGAASRLPHTLANVAALDAWKGNLATARSLASEGLGLAREAGQEQVAGHCVALLAWVAAVHGRRQECEDFARDAVDIASARRVRQPLALATWALGSAAIGARQWEDGCRRLEAVADVRAPEFHPMIAVLSAGDLVEAAGRVGRRDLGWTALAELEEFASRTSAAWTKALAARGRALLTEGAETADLFERALVFHAEGERRFEEARTRLVYGEYLRRERRRVDARMQLRRAIDIFELIGAAPWEERARAELRATGETARKREPSTLTDLTPQQIQIVCLVAEGATNKEVAAQLFLSPRTVDYHLRNVFVKLGITSRAELMRLPDLDELARPALD